MQVSEEFTKIVRRVLVAFTLVLLGFVVSDTVSPRHEASAQNAGVVGLETNEVQVFKNQATASTIVSSILPDFGYAANYVQFQGTNFTGNIDLEWTPAGGSPLAIAQANITDNFSHILQVGGYFPNLRVRLTNASTGGTVNVWYTATAGPIAYTPPALGSNGATSPIACDHTSSQSIASGSTGSPFSPINTADVVIICGFSLSFNGATSAGNVQLGWSASGCPASVTTWEIYTTASTPEFIPVLNQQRSSSPGTASAPCFANNSGAAVYVDITYASVGAGLL